MKRITIERAIEMLREFYEAAQKNPSVIDPVAYSLYHTWRWVQEEATK